MCFVEGQTFVDADQVDDRSLHLASTKATAWYFSFCVGTD